MKTDHPSLATVEQPAMSRAVEGRIPLVDEPPPLGWDLEDLPAAEDGGRAGGPQRPEEDAAGTCCLFPALRRPVLGSALPPARTTCSGVPGC